MHVDAIAKGLSQAGAPEKLAKMVARLFALDGAIGLAMLARDSKVASVELANAFIDLGGRLGLDWAQARAAIMEPSDPWERLLVAGLARDFQQMRFEFLRKIVPSTSNKSTMATRITSWAETQQSAIAQFCSIIARAQASAPVTPAILAQIASQARNLLHR